MQYGYYVSLGYEAPRYFAFRPKAYECALRNRFEYVDVTVVFVSKSGEKTTRWFKGERVVA